MKSLKLNQLSAIEKQNIRGGIVNGEGGGNGPIPWGPIIIDSYHCGCSCAYANQGGASIAANTNANDAKGLVSSTGEIQCWTRVSAKI